MKALTYTFKTEKFKRSVRETFAATAIEGELTRARDSNYYNSGPEYIKGANFVTRLLGKNGEKWLLYSGPHNYLFAPPIKADQLQLKADTTQTNSWHEKLNSLKHLQDLEKNTELSAINLQTNTFKTV